MKIGIGDSAPGEERERAAETLMQMYHSKLTEGQSSKTPSQRWYLSEAVRMPASCAV